MEDTTPLQYNLQDEFWETIINTTYDSVEDLYHKRMHLQEQVAQLESTTFPYVYFQMRKVLENDPDFDVESYLRTCSCSKDISQEVPQKIPDMTNMSVFDIFNYDINYMNTIEELAVKEHKLMRNIQRLKNKNKVLHTLKKKIAKMLDVHMSESVKLNKKLLEDTKARFNKHHKELQKEITKTKADLTKYKNGGIKLSKQLEEIKLNNKKLRYLIKNYDKIELGCRCTYDAKKAEHFREQIEFTNRLMQEQKQENEILYSEFNDLRNQAEQLEDELRINHIKLLGEVCNDFSDMGKVESCYCIKC